MKSKEILITCGNSGIAQGVKNKLEHDGNNVKTTYRNGNGDFELDFFSRESIDSCMKEISKKMIKFDAIAFIIPRIEPCDEVFPNSEKWVETFEKYFINPLYFMEKMIKNNNLKHGASVVMLSGISNKQAMTGYSINNTVRLAWLGQMKTMSLALAPTYKFNSVSLGGVMTEAYTEKLERKSAKNGVSLSEQLIKETDNVPLNKYASINDVANVVVPLLGSFSDHMTGQNILIDGGFVRTY